MLCLVLAHPASPRQRAVKWLLLSLSCVKFILSKYFPLSGEFSSEMLVKRL